MSAETMPQALPVTTPEMFTGSKSPVESAEARLIQRVLSGLLKLF